MPKVNTREIKKALKVEFPDLKFSVTKSGNYSTAINIVILNAASHEVDRDEPLKQKLLKFKSTIGVEKIFREDVNQEISMSGNTYVFF